jgi:hypothetical protein
MKPIPFLLVLTCLAGGPSNVANAQQTLGIGPVTGGSFDRFGDLGQGPAAFTFRHSRLTGAGPGEDVAVRLFPQALAARVALIGADVGIMQAVARGPVALFVKAGASPIIQLDFHHPEIIPGVEAGFGTLLRLERRAALRIDITRHVFFDDGDRHPIWSFGVGLSLLPPAAGNRPR